MNSQWREEWRAIQDAAALEGDQKYLVFELTPVTAIQNFDLGTALEKRDLVIGISPFILDFRSS